MVVLLIFFINEVHSAKIIEMRIFILIIIFISVLSQLLYAQNNKVELYFNKKDSLELEKMIYSAWDNLGEEPLKTIRFARNGLKLARRLNNEKNAAVCLSLIGLGYKNMGEYSSAFNPLHQSLTITEEINQRELSAYTYISLANLYLELENYEKTRFYLKNASKIADSLQDAKLLSYYHINAGRCELKNYNTKNAINELEQARKLGHSTNDYYIKSSSLLELGRAMIIQSEYEKASKLLKEALSYARKGKMDKQKCLILIELSRIDFRSKKYKKALATVDSCLIIKYENTDNEIYKNALEIKAQCYAALERFDMAYQAQTKATRYKDSIFAEEKSNLLSELEISNEKIKTKNENEILRLTNEKQKIQIRTYWYIMIVGAVLIIGLVLFFMNRFYEKQVANKSLEEKNKRISDQNHFIQALFHTLPSPIYYKDKYGYYVDCNKLFEKLIGSNKSEIIGKTPNDFFPDELANKLYMIDQQLMENPEVTTYESYLRYADGTTHDVIYTKSTFNDANGEIAGVMGIITDITERKRKEKELLEINEMKDKLISIISHDLRNPMANLRYTIDLAMNMDQPFDNKVLAKYLKLAFQTSNTMYNLLENLLAWAQNQKGSLEYLPEHIDLNNIVEDTLTLVHLNAKNKQIGIDVQIPRNLKVYADENLLGTVIRNLLSNALKFTNKNGRVKISAQPKYNEVVISVEDNGIGMDKEAINKLLNRKEFFTTFGTNHEKGSGLGFNLCKDFVERNGGKIWIDSASGKGSTFYFSVPSTKAFFDNY